ncbi:hypothetical protein GF345_06420 [Candidatus Woesearchaeota archaeon]|nr:hypothetical protein [Candidatus Woesearchaeota archaeon]
MKKRNREEKITGITDHISHGLLRIMNDHSARIVLMFIAVYALVQAVGLVGFYAYGWDESVYLHMSRSIISGGSEGLMENLRPVMFPVLLMPFSASMIASRVFVLFMSLAGLWVFFRIGSQGIEKRMSWIFPVMLAAFPFYIISSASVMTEIPSLLFHGLSVYLLIRKRYVLSGLSAFLAFFIRFPFGIYIPILFIGAFFIERSFRSMARFFLGVVAGLPLFILNTWLFFPKTGNLVFAAFYPLINQLLDHTVSGYVWFYDKGASFYPNYFLGWTPLSLFLIAGVVIASVMLKRMISSAKKSSLSERFNILAFALMLFPALYLMITPHKEVRYLMLASPWIIYMICFGLTESLRRSGEWLKKANPGSRERKMIRYSGIILLILLFAHLMVNSFVMASGHYRAPQTFYDEYLLLLEDAPEHESVLTATPMIETRAEIVVGYYNADYFLEMLLDRRYDHVFYTYSWFPCRQDDLRCLKTRKDTQSYLDDNYDMHNHYEKHGEDYWVYSSPENV